ncbi:hypothetical protein PYK79_06420 [Streptomyces sp. ID05-04B]|uniref:hypothetical protein n=1 Tax=unclassified Streptomyces TaxID=2593676 RepID=UPI00131EE744|nr:MULTISPECIES: hypothetical protein [unclassified Streptomyces]MDX5563125.1 hypothetical protein [Streptomyces sp. ID05-04B]
MSAKPSGNPYLPAKALRTFDFSGAIARQEHGKGVQMQVLIAINLVLAGFSAGRAWQFVRDARSAMGTDRRR